MADVRITVVKKLTNKDLIDRYGKGVEPACERFKIGDEFVVKNLKMPGGFCSWAWTDTQRDVAVLALDGNFFGSSRKELGSAAALRASDPSSLN